MQKYISYPSEDNLAVETLIASLLKKKDSFASELQYDSIFLAASVHFKYCIPPHSIKNWD